MASFNDALLNANGNGIKLTATENNALGEEIEEVWTRDTSGIYAWYDDYSDENYSEVDSNKNITLNHTQAVVLHEVNSQFIPFRMPRYYDGQDLSKGSIQIHWVNTGNNEGGRDFVCNVQYSDNYIKFGWLLTEGVAKVVGNIQFEIDIIGNNSRGENYRYISRTNSAINILKSLGEHDEYEYDETMVDDFIRIVQEKLSEAAGIATEARSYSEGGTGTRSGEDTDNAKYYMQQAQAAVQEGIDASMTEAVSDYIDNEFQEINQVFEANYYDKEALDQMFADIDGLADFGVVYDDTTNHLMFYNKGEEVESGGVTVDGTTYKKIGDVQINSLDDLGINYNPETGKLTLYNKDIVVATGGVTVDGVMYKIIGEVTIYSEPTATWTLNFRSAIGEDIADAVAEVSGDVTSYTEEVDGETVDHFKNLVAYEKQTDTDLASIHSAIDDLPSTLASDYYTKSATDTLLDAKADKSTVSTLENTVSGMRTDVATHTSTISSYGTKIETLETGVAELESAIADAQNTTYDVDYNADTGAFSFYTNPVYDENENITDQEGLKVFTIQGGGGGGDVTTSTVTIRRISPATMVSLVNNGVIDKTLVQFTYESVDTNGEAVPGDASCIWKLDRKQIATSTCEAGNNSFDITAYLKEGSQSLSLQVTDPLGTVKTQTWVIKVVAVRLESTFNDKITYTAGRDITVGFIPYGADVEKTIKYELRDKNNVIVGSGSYVDTNSGYTRSFTITGKAHGSYYLDLWMEATVNNIELDIPHIYKDVLFRDTANTTPLIGVSPQSYDATEYDTVAINYLVIDPTTDTPTVELRVYDTDDNLITSETQYLTSTSGLWNYKATTVGDYRLEIVCRDAVKDISLHVEKLSIDITQVTDGLIYDFNPAGKSNASTDTTATNIWTSDENDVHLTVSDNFDWVNGGYQIDANGDTFFCVKAGTRAYIDHKMFAPANDIRVTGMEFKTIYKVTNVADYQTTVISCIDGTNNVGLRVNPHEAYINSSASSLYVPLSEEDVIEFEFNVAANTESVPMVMTYEDGVPCMPLIYSDADVFNQSTGKIVTIGSDNCDVQIYRMRAYDKSLTNKNILDNFIADGRNAIEIVDRYNRNSIYNSNGELTPDSVYAACPDLRVITISSSRFTTSKSDSVPGATIRCRYKGTANDDPETIRLNNWEATGSEVAGQGTSSNAYGASARNIDIKMNVDGAVITLDEGDEVVSKVALTADSIPNAYFNIKLNVASSENANNALLQKRYDRFIPYHSVAKLRDSRVKNSMEFFNCVVFIQETDSNVSNHTEFIDKNIHFYGIGNIGDSKKTDKTRADDPDDALEFCVELMDVDRPLSEFPTTAMNPLALELVDADDFGEKTFEYNGETYKSTYGIRYGNKKDADNMARIKGIWSQFYRFVVRDVNENSQASIDSWKSDFANWFVVDSALYYYLFTLYNTMIDNRAKNTFWYWSKMYISESEAAEMGEEKAARYIVDNTAAAVNDGYRFQFWDYDNDSSLGINNTGKFTMSYGVEDFDKDEQGNYHFRCANSTFFVRVAKYFESEIASLYNDIQSACWSAADAISEFDSWQEQFPEELWRLDFERKYLRPYNGTIKNPNGATDAEKYFFPPAANYLEEMANGRKKYQRRQFLRDQEIYMASKFVSNTAVNSKIQLRCSNPSSYVVTPNYAITVTPYMNMYLNIYNGQVQVLHRRVEAGVPYTVQVSDSSGADFIYIYSANRIQSLGDLSALYLNYCDIGSAEKLKEFVVGNTTPGYQNTALVALAFGSNALLSTIDMRNLPSLTSAFDFSNLAQLQILHAEGSAISGVSFANGGMLAEAYLPATITTISAKNLSYLTTFEIAGIDNLANLTIENIQSINTYELLRDAPLLSRIRLTGINWPSTYDIENTDVFDKAMGLGGFDSSGAITGQSVLTGEAYVDIVRQQKWLDYRDTWSQLTINYGSMIETVIATFVNEDGTVLDVQYIDRGGRAVDPVTRTDNPIATPTKASTVDKVYTFSGWDRPLNNSLLENATFTAIYTSETRQYTINYLVDGAVKQTTLANYGEIVEYTGETPTYTSQEGSYSYYLFDGWDKSGYVSGDKNINAIFDKCTYTPGYFTGRDISEMRPVEIYALTQASRQISGMNVSDYVELKDSIAFNMGKDYTYSDIEQVELISDASDAMFKGQRVFDGASVVLDTGIKLFEEDRDWVLAVDYKFDAECPADRHLVWCRLGGARIGMSICSAPTTGIPSVVYSSSASTQIAEQGSRDIVVIRHKKGESKLTVYKGNLPSSMIVIEDLDATLYQTTNSDTATLVFGASKTAEDYEKFAKGTIYWAKLWYSDLGDSACRSLASWTHEKIEMEVAGFRQYYFSDGSERRSSLTFIGKYALSNAMQLHNDMTNTGGWAVYTLNTFLNDRFYKAIPSQWRGLIKKVIVTSATGEGTETSSSDCYVYVPAVLEVSPNETSAEPYIYECETGGISWMITPSDRQRGRMGEEGYVDYFTRSPRFDQNIYVYSVAANGTVYAYSYATNIRGVVIEFSV